LQSFDAGVLADVHGSLGTAIVSYRAAREQWEKRTRRQVSRTAELTVMPSLHALTENRADNNCQASSRRS